MPDGIDKGTLDAYNGIKASECLLHAERLTPYSQPFSWVLFRPPWASNNKCCKACVCYHMKIYAEDVSTIIANCGMIEF